MARVLVIDDSKSVRVLVKDLLEKSGYSVTAVESTNLGIAELRRERFDLVLLDLDMPDKDGVACLTIIRGDPALHKIPVFMVTGAALRDVVMKVAKLGVAGIILKDGNWAPHLIERVNVFLATVAAREPAAKPRPTTAPTSPRPAPASSTAAQAPRPAARMPVAPIPAPRSAALREVPVWQPPTIPAHDEEMSDQKAMEVLATLTPIIHRSELLETMLSETIDVRALRPAVQQVLRLSQNPDTSLQQLTAAIRQDQALSLRILKMANSTLYAHGDHVDTIAKAVTRIGLTQIHTVVLTVGVLDAFDGVQATGTFRPDWFWEHATACGLLATKIAIASSRPKDYCETIFTAGLLHDLGRLLYVEHLPEHYPHVVDTAHHLELPLELIETRLLLLNHADITDRLLHHWKFAPAMILPVTHHHLSIGNIKTTAPRASNDIVPLALANRLAHALLLGSSGNEVLYPLEEFVDHLRLSHKMVREMCAKARDEVTEMRLNMILHSGAQTGSYLDDVRQRLGDVRPITLSLHPEVDPLSIMLETLCGSTPPEHPNLLILRICESRDRVASMRLLETATEAARGNEDNGRSLPVLVVGNSKACLFTANQISNRTVRQVILPRTMSRLLRDMRELAGVVPVTA